MKRATYRAVIAYDGTAFAGFAHVPGEHTVWSVLLGALRKVAPGLSKLASAGRTDRGVSAVGQVVSFISSAPVDCDLVARAIDEASPGALAALEVRRVVDQFHAQFSARSRRYAYFLPDDPAIDVARVDGMLGALVGRRDFGAFARDTPSGKDTVKTLFSAGARRVAEDGRVMIRFDFLGEAFLRRQIRVLVATSLREAALGGGDEALVELAALGDRWATARPAAPEGLVLVGVGYDPIERKRPVPRPPRPARVRPSRGA